MVIRQAFRGSRSPSGASTPLRKESIYRTMLCLLVDRLRKEVPTLDTVMTLYLTESLKCFRNGTFVASAVMVGVAAEQMMMVLRKAVYDALSSQDKKKRFDDDAQGQIKRIYDAVWKKLDPVREQMPERPCESVGVELGLRTCA